MVMGNERIPYWDAFVPWPPPALLGAGAAARCGLSTTCRGQEILRGSRILFTLNRDMDVAEAQSKVEEVPGSDKDD